MWFEDDPHDFNQTLNLQLRFSDADIDLIDKYL